MNQQENKNDYQEQGPKKGIVIIVITILLGTNGLLLWQFFDKKSKILTTKKTEILKIQIFLLLWVAFKLKSSLV